MKSDQGTTIVIIVFSLLSVLLMVLCVVFYRSSSEKAQQLETATKKASDLEGSLRTANTDVETLKQIIGAASTVPVADIEASNKKYANQVEGTQDVVKGYTNLVDQLIAKLDGVNKELALANTAKVDLENKYAVLYADTQNQIKIHEDAAAADRKKLQEEQAKYTATMAQRSEVKQTLQNEYREMRESSEKSITQAKTEAAYAERKVQTINKANEILNQELSSLRSPVLTREDGRVVTVNQSSGIVNLDIGSASGLRNGITFAVFDPAEKNLSEARSKGSIEVSQILGPNRAEARILETVITDPIQKGDLIYTPVWKPGQHPIFVLSGRMVVRGFGSRSLDDTTREDDMKDVINLILANGGVVDYYTKSDGSVMKVDWKTDRHGKIVILGESPVRMKSISEDEDTGEIIKGEGDELSVETAFIVEGVGDPMSNTLMSNMKVLAEQAKLNGIRSITLPELLRQMGWRNAVPSQGYGSRANESDIISRPSKAMPVSQGSTVSPLYSQQADVAAKLSPGTVSPLYRKDGAVMKPSVGTVSPLYHKERKPVNVAPGEVSGIYGGN